MSYGTFCAICGDYKSACKCASPVMVDDHRQACIVLRKRLEADEQVGLSHFDKLMLDGYSPKRGRPKGLPWSLMADAPWNVLDSSGLRVARCDFDGDMSSPECRYNAQYIVTAVNNHEALRDKVRDLQCGLQQALHDAESWKQVTEGRTND